MSRAFTYALVLCVNLACLRAVFGFEVAVLAGISLLLFYIMAQDANKEKPQ